MLEIVAWPNGERTNDCVEHAGQHEVVDVAALAADERRVLLAQDALADAARGGAWDDGGHRQALAISPAACFTAATMFW